MTLTSMSLPHTKPSSTCRLTNFWGHRRVSDPFLRRLREAGSIEYASTLSPKSEFSLCALSAALENQDLAGVRPPACSDVPLTTKID